MLGRASILDDLSKDCADATDSGRVGRAESVRVVGSCSRAGELRVRAAVLSRRSDAVRFEVKFRAVWLPDDEEGGRFSICSKDVGVRGGVVSGESGNDAVASGCSLSLETGTTGDGSLSFLALSRRRLAGVGGLGDSCASRSRTSASSEGIDSEDRDRKGESAPRGLLLVTLQDSDSMSTDLASMSADFSVAVSLSSGPDCKMLHDFGLELDSDCRKSSARRLPWRPRRWLRKDKERGLGMDVMASSAATEGETAWGSWAAAREGTDSGRAETVPALTRRGLPCCCRLLRTGMTTGCEGVTAETGSRRCGFCG